MIGLSVLQEPVNVRSKLRAASEMALALHPLRNVPVSPRRSGTCPRARDARRGRLALENDSQKDRLLNATGFP